jgi:hypothetical protein
VARKAFYGGSAAPLSVRHPDKTAPVVISGWALTAWILMAVGTSLSQLASIVIAVLTGRRIAKAMRGAETSLADVAVIATRGLWSAALQLASALCRHYWPLALIAAVFSRHCRRVLVVAAVMDGVVDWLRRRDGGSTTWRTDWGCGGVCCANVTCARSNRRSGPSRRLDHGHHAQRCADRRCWQRWIGCRRTPFRRLQLHGDRHRSGARAL